MEKNDAKKILIANLKGSKKKCSPLLTIAQAVRLLLNDAEYGSTTKLAKSFGVRRPTIEAFDKMNEQPDEIKKLITEGKIGIDASTKLSVIPDQRKRAELAKTVAGLNAEQTRRTIAYFKKHPKASFHDCKQAAVNFKPPRRNVRTVMVRLERREYEAFAAASKKASLQPAEAGKQAISKWIKSQEKATEH